MQNFLTVSEFNEFIKNVLRDDIGEVMIQGEVSGFRITGDKLVFFELKDKKSRILCFLLKYELKVEIEDGMEIQIYGLPSIFQTSGSFHIRVISIALVGQGALSRAFELLKAKLAQEGLFDLARKRALPKFPNSIGIITSKDGAAYTDILRILNNKWCGLKIFCAHTTVQGAYASNSIMAAIAYFNKVQLVDIIILARGGGSLEDLQAFNLENVARAIFSSKIPIICGVGHERDITIADLVADVRASTPTNAAMLAVPDRQEILDKVEHDTMHIISAIEYLLSNYLYEVNRFITTSILIINNKILQARYVYDCFQKGIRNFQHLVLNNYERIARLVGAMESYLKIYIINLEQKLTHTLDLIHKLNPLNILSKGYSITYLDNKVLKDSSIISIGKTIRTVLHKGEISSTVVDKH